MELPVIDCPYWKDGRCGDSSVNSIVGTRPTAGVCMAMCGNAPTGETIELPDPALLHPGVEAATWGDLHLRALREGVAGFAAYVESFTARIGCGTCVDDWAAWVAANPPPGEAEGDAAAWEWTVAAHNAVNEKIGHPVLSVEEALAVWQPEI